jgi:hypothetical protein
MTRLGGGWMAVAEVTVAFGILTDVRLSQDCCAKTRPDTKQTPRNRSRHRVMRPFIDPPMDAACDVYTAPPVVRKGWDRPEQRSQA